MERMDWVSIAWPLINDFDSSSIPSLDLFFRLTTGPISAWATSMA